MSKKIVVAGATGNLGGKVVNALLNNGAKVIAITRLETDKKDIDALKEKGVKVFQVDTLKLSEVAKCCEGADCVVSTLSGLKETIIDTQKVLVEAAIQANVQRFIPSDYSIDFTNLIEGRNRNLDLRKEFYRYIEEKPIKVTTIFNGAYMELLTTDMPLILFKIKRILCWGNPDQPMEFTVTDDVAKFTALAALDDNTPRYLRIAGDRLSSIDFVKLLTKLTGENFKLLKPGGISLLNFLIKVTRFFSPSKGEIYPAWQGMQYMRDMMEGRINFQKYENERYSEVKWTSVEEFLKNENVKSRM